MEKRIFGIDAYTWLLLGGLVQIFVPGLGFVGAILMYFYAKDTVKDEWTAEGFRQIVNFELTAFIVAAVIGVPMFILGFIPLIGILVWIIGSVALFAYGIYVFVAHIIGAMRANNKEIYSPSIKFEFFKK